MAGLFLAGTVHAARLEIPYDIGAGFAGTVRDGALYPVTVTLDNRVAPTRGRIELRQPDVAGNADVVQTLEFDLPMPSVKRFRLLVRAEADRELDVAVRFEEQILPVRQAVRLQHSRAPLVLCVDLPKEHRPGKGVSGYRLVSVAAGYLPEDPLGLDGVHAIVIPGAVLARLGPDPVRAMRDWLKTGGILVIVEPVAGMASGRNGTILGLEQLSMERARVGWCRSGAGAVAWAPADGSEGPAGWDPGPDWVQVLFPAVADEAYWRGRDGGLIGGLWKIRRSYGWGGVFWTLVIVLAYAFVIGPVDRWLVRRTGRPALTWVFFAAAIGVFAWIAYAYTRFVNVGVMRSVGVSVVDMDAAGPVARGRAYAWVYSARNSTYDVMAAHSNACLSARESALGAAAASGVRIGNGAQPVALARIPVFSARELDMGWYGPVPWRFDAVRTPAGYRVTMPAGLKVDTAFVAERGGLVVLQPTEDSWSQDAPARPWQDLAREWSGAINTRLEAWNSGREDEDLLMPTDVLLRQYLLLASHVVVPQSINARGVATDDPGVEEIVSRRSAEERVWAITSRVQMGPVLYVFVVPPGDGAFRLPGTRPRRAQLQLIRVQLPGNM